MKLTAIAALLALAAGASQATTIFEGEAFLATGPNDTTATAQDLGWVAPSSFLDVFGSRLDALPGTSSADFYKITVTAPTILTLATHTATGPTFGSDTVLGLFDAGGVPLLVDDDSGPGWDSAITYAVSAGTYYIGVSGFSDFSFSGGGSTDYVYSLEVSAAVPEPETLAMMLAGLGALGFLARRRNGQ